MGIKYINKSRTGEEKFNFSSPVTLCIITCKGGITQIMTVNVISPIDLNFLLFIRKVYHQSWYFDHISSEDFCENFEEELHLLWNHSVNSLMMNGKYILNDHAVKECTQKLIRNKEIAHKFIKHFENFWYHLPQFGFGSLMERTCASLLPEQIEAIVGTNCTHIVVVFDAFPAKYCKEIPQHHLKVVPYTDFLKYI